MKKSFTLIETIIAITILTIGVSGVFALISRLIATTTFSENRLIAAYLGQEAIEIVRNIRDENWLNQRSWTEYILPGTFYNFDYRSKSIPDNVNCSGRNYLVFQNGFYQCSDTPSPNFLQRRITISHFINYLDIRVEVSWRERGIAHSYSVAERLYNWRQ